MPGRRSLGVRRRAQAPAAVCWLLPPASVWAMGDQHGSGEVLFRPRVLSPTVVGEGWLCLSTDVSCGCLHKLRKDTQRCDDWSLCPSAKPRFVADSSQGREHCWEVSRRNFSLGVSFLGW